MANKNKSGNNNPRGPRRPLVTKAGVKHGKDYGCGGKLKK